MSDIENKRQFLLGLYPGPNWKKRVTKMPDAQVIAIYLREVNTAFSISLNQRRRQRREAVIQHPFESGPPPEEEGDARPMPCPQCESTKGYSRVGNYRVHCLNCNALLKNEEVDMQLPDQEKQ